MHIAKSSPLYTYWNSEQVENDENIRLLKLNKKESASILFKNEPYKWENLYQSVVRNLIRGDQSSIKALRILLSSISKKEKDTSLKALDKLLDKSVMRKIRNNKYQEINSSGNFFTAFTILIIIFIIPYGL